MTYGIDQYRDPVPNDLVLLELPANLKTEEYINPLFDVDWYQDSEIGALWVSRSAVEKVSLWVAEVLPFDRPEDIRAISNPVPDREQVFFLIDRILRRYSGEDGFYHA